MNASIRGERHPSMESTLQDHSRGHLVTTQEESRLQESSGRKKRKIVDIIILHSHECHECIPCMHADSFHHDKNTNCGGRDHHRIIQKHASHTQRPTLSLRLSLSLTVATPARRPSS